jgi:hypothetical protein
MCGEALPFRDDLVEIKEAMPLDFCEAQPRSKKRPCGKATPYLTSEVGQFEFKGPLVTGNAGALARSEREARTRFSFEDMAGHAPRARAPAFPVTSSPIQSEIAKLTRYPHIRWHSHNPIIISRRTVSIPLEIRSVGA